MHSGTKTLSHSHPDPGCSASPSHSLHPGAAPTVGRHRDVDVGSRYEMSKAGERAEAWLVGIAGFSPRAGEHAGLDALPEKEPRESNETGRWS